MIYRQMKFVAYAAHALDMIGMIMSDENSIYPVNLYIISFQGSFQNPDTYSSIYENACISCSQIIAIATATRPQREKF